MINQRLGGDRLEFQENDVEKLDLDKSVSDVAHLIVRFLCGKNYDPTISPEDQVLIKNLMANTKGKGLNYRQLNELLLLLNQDTIGEDFFTFFFGENVKTLDELKKGVIRFRGFALLCFGNFKFAYRQLCKMNIDQLSKRLRPYSRKPADLIRAFNGRPQRLIQIRSIERQNAWYLGEISGGRVNLEIENALRITQLTPKKSSKDSDFIKFAHKLGGVENRIKRTQSTAIQNTGIYLTWDYMDLYVATSMRNSWEYEETYDFLKEVFRDNDLKGLNIRYFDPTQSMCTNARDKGLVEGLMLKCALCALYLAQESDTMGKDCELAATLAQGKPVIAYVPKYDPKDYAKKIAKYPLDFFKKRLSILDAEEVFEDPEFESRLEGHDKDFRSVIAEFIKELKKYRSKQPFTLWAKKEDEFKKSCRFFKKICRIIAAAECYNFDNRAGLLRGKHPLCMQVDLQRGVANGVLVVRSAKECASLLFRILTNQTKFAIEHRIPGKERGEKEGYTVLEEEISGSAFRVVTDYERLTNSFWNLFEATTNNLYTL